MSAVLTCSAKVKMTAVLQGRFAFIVQRHIVNIVRVTGWGGVFYI